MAFGIPGSDAGGDNGPFLGRVQYDARTGFWKTVDRVQTSDGWSSKESEFYQNPSFLMDFASFEVGYIKLSSPPAFMLVPYGAAIPVQPEEKNDQGRKAFSPGFRVKVLAKKLFGDSEPRFFASSTKTVMGPMEQVFNDYLRAPEAAQGLVPLVAQTSTQTIEIKTPQGVNRFKAPVLTIQSWHARPDVLGERTVVVSGASVATTPPAPSAKAVPPPAPKAAPQPEMAGADDDLPF